MTWPTSQDYNEAVQDPATNLSDPALRRGEVAVNALGLPVTRSGNFADVYQFMGADGRTWALKCFTRKVSGLQERYANIDEHLSHARLPFTVGFQFLQRGICVRGEWYPLLKMEWVEGPTLNEFVAQNLGRPPVLHALLQMWAKLARRLREADMAHADLQHGNVLLVPGSTPQKLGLKLIDYDGMWVPALAKHHSGEAGHPNFQHPLRLKDRLYNGEVDRFPHLVVAAALRAILIGGKTLWEQFDNGDNLLFKEADLRDPANAPIFKILWELNDPVLCVLVGHLALSTKQAMRRTPWLDDVLLDEDGPQLTSQQEKQVCALLGVAASADLADVHKATKFEQEFNVFEFQDDDDQSEKLRQKTELRRRQSSKKKKDTGLPIVLSVAGAGLAVLLLAVVIWAIATGGPSAKAPTSLATTATTTKKPPRRPEPIILEPYPAVILNGSWRFDKGDLVQDRVDEPARIFFGNPEWSNYDVEFDAQIQDDTNGFGVAVRAADPSSGYVFAFGMNEHKTQTLTRWEEGTARNELQKRENHIQPNKWYKVKIEVRNDRMTCHLENKRTFDHSDGTSGKGMVGLLAWSRTRFRNIKLTVHQSSPPDLVLNALTLPAILSPVGSSGDIWQIEGDELVQTTHLPDVRLVFGDKNWKDYDFTFEAMKLSGAEGFGPLFRAQSYDNAYLAIFGGWANSRHGVQGQRLDRQRIGFIEAGRWYKVLVKVRGDSTSCLLDDEEIFSGIPIANLSGSVGLRTFRTATRFRKIKVTAPDGKVLFAGMPDLNKALGLRMPVPISLDRETIWQYTTDKPPDEWKTPGFADSSWKTGKGGFGTHSTLSATVRTVWNHPDIWLRRDFDIPPGIVPALELFLQYDDDVDVYLNGILAYESNGVISEYRRVAIAQAAREALRPGKNVLAVHCHDHGGAAYVDGGIVESLGENGIARKE